MKNSREESIILHGKINGQSFFSCNIHRKQMTMNTKNNYDIIPQEIFAK